MKEKEATDWISQPRIRRILHALSIPRTPRQVERILGLRKLKMKPFLRKGLVKCLNAEARKSRYYVLTDKGRGVLKLPVGTKEGEKDWELIGWVMASPRQRVVVLQTMGTDEVKRTSEQIRKRASRFNPHLTRMSTKTILNELISKGLVETEMNGVYRNYWLRDRGKSLVRDGLLNKKCDIDFF